jgi:hypothetical protein
MGKNAKRSGGKPNFGEGMLDRAQVAGRHKTGTAIEGVV